MRKSSLFILGFFLFFLASLTALILASNRYDDWAQVRVSSFYVPNETVITEMVNRDWGIPADTDFAPLPDYLQQSLVWLAENQAADGGWGAGLHSRQNVRDPQQVATDPATTAMVAMAFLRSGTHLQGGAYRAIVANATE